MSIISGPFPCFECSKPKEIVMTIHRLYSDKQEAQERIKKIKEIGYKNALAIDWEITAFVYKKSGAMIVFPIFIHFHTASIMVANQNAIKQYLGHITKSTRQQRKNTSP